MGCSKLRNKAPSGASPAPSGTATGAPWPSRRTTPSQHLRSHRDWPRADRLQAKSRPSSAVCPSPGGDPHLHEDPLPRTASVPSPCLSTLLKPRRSPPSLVSPSLFILQTNLASRHLRGASYPPPPHFSVFPEPRPPPSDSITCPHPAPRFSFNQIQASAPRLSPSQLAPACSTGLGASTSLAHQDRCCAADLATGLPRC